jgi:hypothetical protein
MDKPVSNRVRECVTIVKKLTEQLGLDEGSEEIKELRGHMNTYIKTGEEWSGTVDFSKWGRIAHCRFPKKANQTVEITLKVCE